MKLLSILIFVFTISFSAQANHNHYNFLTVVIDGADGELEKVIYYPKGSTYRVYLTKKDKETVTTEDFVTYQGNMQLTIYPKFRKYKPIHFDIKGKRLRIFWTAQGAFDAGFGADWNNDSETVNENSSENSSKITLKKELIASKKYSGKYNVTLTFSNGIVFKYTDGKFNAKLHDKYINIKGEYMIEMESGILKFSYNPKTGKVWWIFDKNNSL